MAEKTLAETVESLYGSLQFNGLIRSFRWELPLEPSVLTSIMTLDFEVGNSACIYIVVWIQVAH